jgi:hypothetical protein
MSEKDTLSKRNTKPLLADCHTSAGSSLQKVLDHSGDGKDGGDGAENDRVHDFRLHFSGLEKSHLV